MYIQNKNGHTKRFIRLRHFELLPSEKELCKVLGGVKLLLKASDVQRSADLRDFSSADETRTEPPFGVYAVQIRGYASGPFSQLPGPTR